MKQAAYNVPEEIPDIRTHRRCGIHVQTLLLGYCLLTVLTSLIGIGLGLLLLFYPHIHHRSLIYKQVFQHYAKGKANSYALYYRISIYLWIGLHAVHLLTTVFTVIATQVIRPRLLIPQLIILVAFTGLFLLAVLAVATLSVLLTRLIWMSGLIALFYLIATTANLYLLVLTHRFVSDRRETIQRILASTKTVTFKERRS